LLCRIKVIALDANRFAVPRSYTISSSPVHENYVEITPKRMENGCVSVFLNEQAKPGLVAA
jgi:ferredoxin-NADP reductase